MTPERRLLYVNPPGHCTLVPHLQQANWQVNTVTPAQFKKQQCAQEKHDLGLMHFPLEGDFERFVHDCLALNDSEWVALLPRKLAETPSIRRLISEHFLDFHTQPVDNMKIANTLGHAWGMANLRRTEPSQDLEISDEQMIGCSPCMTNLFGLIRKVAASHAPVLITGETGTGKELTARAIHERSSRSKGPFIAINCGAIPHHLIQSELFGYERGAFTGANQRKIGRIEQANHGTLFLDEIGDLPLEMQANLLRFLQESQVDRIGGARPIDVDVRVVAATHVDLPQAVNNQRFREDLYHRLGVLCLHMPALRERGDDIEILARYYFNHFAEDGRRSLRGFSRGALEALVVHPWPGNIRELINRVRRAIVMTEGLQITSSDLGLSQTGESPIDTENAVSLTLEASREQADRHALRKAMQRSPSNMSRVATELGISRVTLYRLLERYGMHPSRRTA